MKLLHTADWQIGMKAAHTGDAGARVREARLTAARTLVRRARELGAELILVAGDTFEDNGVDRVLVQRVADILGEYGGPVLIIPGNHDPLVPGCVWEHPVWRSGTASRLRVLTRAEPVEVGGAIIYPCPALGKHSLADPTAWIPRDSGNQIRLGIAHGTVEGVRQDEPDYPIARNAAERAGLDYLALGHWHSFATYNSGGAPRMAYSGTHETTKFGERQSGKAALVEIDSPGAQPRVTPVPVGTLRWLLFERELRASGELSPLRSEIEALGERETTLVEARLGGLLHPSEQGELRRIEEVLASGFLHGRLETSRLGLAPQSEGWLDRLPPGPVRVAAGRLQELAGASGDGPGAAARGSRAAATLALLELYALLEEPAP